jgi:predicted NUDIX family NTP pyrophosphohydrolase
MSMASCANKTETIENSTIAPSTATATASKAAPDQNAGFTALQGVVSATKTAVAAGKLDVAKTEIAKFEAAWKPVEDGVKAKSPENYKAIEASVEEIETGITKKQPKDALLASLQKLSQSVDKASK